MIASSAEITGASMRPRVFPAEDRPSHPSVAAALIRTRCFNEAAGIPRGRPRIALTPNDIEPLRPHASMRPRVFPAEDARRLRKNRRVTTGTRCFNEAAGIPRGRLRHQGPSETYHRKRFDASMRPRVFPAEDMILDPGGVRRVTWFMLQ